VASCEPAEPVSLELNEMVRGIARAIKLSLGDQVQLRVEIDSDPLVCLVDERQFTHIVTALAANAVDAMPAGGELTIRLRRSTDESVVLEVVDTGCGMTADVVGRAFEPFFTTKPRESGTGLGLAMVYGQVRQNAGEVTIRSTPGVGSSVAVVLPGHDPAEDRAADHAGAGLN
jgi:signal transduction histidine kinase